MAGEIAVPYTTGSTLYATVISSAGAIWNGSTFEAPLAANWSTYPVTMAEQSTTGIYEGTFPAVAAGTYSILAYRRIGGSPATTDPVVGSGEVRWTGTAVQPIQTGDSFARIGAAGTGLTALGDTRIANLDAAITSRSSHTAADVWAAGTRTLTAFGFTVTVDGLTTAALADLFDINSGMTYASAVNGSVVKEIVSNVAGGGGGGALPADGLDAIEVEPGINLRQAMSPILASAAAVLSGAGTGTIVVKAAGNPSVTRITASTDAVGNRPSVTLNLPA